MSVILNQSNTYSKMLSSRRTTLTMFNLNLNNLILPIFSLKISNMMIIMMTVVVAVTGEFVVAGIVVARVVALVARTVFNVRSASTAMLTWASTAGVGPISGSSHLCHKTVGMVHLLLRITELVRTGIGPINGLAQTSLTCLRRISGPLLMDGIQVIGAGLQVLGMHPVTLQAPWPK